MRRLYAKKSAPKAGELYIYDVIGDGFFGGVSDKTVKEALDGLGAVEDLHVFVNSPGGSVFQGLAIYNQIKRHSAKVTMHVDALAASAASLILMAGDSIEIAFNADIMIHDPWGWVAGNADEMRKTADLLDKVRDQLVDTYALRTKLDKTDISQMMSEETWMNASEALDFGFADVITGNEEEATEDAAAAVVSPILNEYQNTPDKLRKVASATRVMIADMDQYLRKRLDRSSKSAA